MLTFTLNFTETPNEDEVRAARYIIDNENARITQANEQLEEDQEPTPLYPQSTGGQLKSSYLSILSDRVGDVHASYVEQAKEALARELTVNDKRDMLVDVKEAIDAGLTIDQIKNLTKAIKNSNSARLNAAISALTS